MSMPITMSAGYIRTDTWKDAVESIGFAQKVCDDISCDEQRWKWLLVALHSALQGFMALSLEHGNSLQVLRDDVAAKWLEAHVSQKPYPEDRMDFFPSLYEKIKSDDVARYFGAKKYVPGKSHDHSVAKLSTLRNHFIHFFPKSWSIELAGLPQICLDCLDVIEFLGWQSGAMIWHDNNLRERASRSVALLKAQLVTLQKAYALRS